MNLVARVTKFTTGSWKNRYPVTGRQGNNDKIALLSFIALIVDKSWSHKETKGNGEYMELGLLSRQQQIHILSHVVLGIHNCALCILIGLHVNQIMSKLAVFLHVSQDSK